MPHENFAKQRAERSRKNHAFNHHKNPYSLQGFLFSLVLFHLIEKRFILFFVTSNLEFLFKKIHNYQFGLDKILQKVNWITFCIAEFLDRSVNCLVRDFNQMEINLKVNYLFLKEDDFCGIKDIPHD